MENDRHSPGLPHVQLGEEGGRIVVQVADYELFDFVGDHLTETCEIAYESVRFANSIEPMNTMIFPFGTDRAKVDVALNKLDPLELERVFRINNPAEAEE